MFDVGCSVFDVFYFSVPMFLFDPSGNEHGRISPRRSPTRAYPASNIQYPLSDFSFLILHSTFLIDDHHRTVQRLKPPLRNPFLHTRLECKINSRLSIFSPFSPLL